MTANSSDCIDKQGATIDSKTLRVLPPPRLNLTTTDDLRREMAKLYRDARNGLLPTQDATRLGYLLDLMRKMIETNDIEKRLEQLELKGKK